MAIIRTASLAAHAAGQAFATAHVFTHSLGAAIYTQQAVWRAPDPREADAAVTKERDWKYRHLVALRERSAPDN